MNDQFNKSPGNSEQKDISIRIATPDDWKEYRDLIIEALNGPDQEMFNMYPGEEESEIRRRQEREKTEDGWKKELEPDPSRFVLLSWVQEKCVGMGVAMRTLHSEWKTSEWKISFGYVTDNFRGQNIQKKMIEMRLNEIKKRGGKEVVALVKAHNDSSIHNLELFGFKKIKVTKLKPDGRPEGYIMQLKFLNAG